MCYSQGARGVSTKGGGGVKSGANVLQQRCEIRKAHAVCGQRARGGVKSGADVLQLRCEIRGACCV